MIQTKDADPAGNAQDRTRDLFTILWAFARINAVRRTLPAQNIFRRVWLTGPHDILKRTTQPFVTYWWTHLETAWDGLAADIAGSDSGLRELATAWAVTGPDTSSRGTDPERPAHAQPSPGSPPRRAASTWGRPHQRRAARRRDERPAGARAANRPDTSLILEEQRRVDILDALWIG